MASCSTRAPAWPARNGITRIEALDRFLLDLLQPQDEVFLYRFSNDPVLVQDWTTDRMLLSHVLDRIVPRGGTAMYDALAEAVPLADTGHNRKKAIVVISDGNDNRSQTSVPELKHMIHNSEVLIYAIGIDGEEQQQYPRARSAGRRASSFRFQAHRDSPGPGRGLQAADKGTDALAGCAEGTST